MVSALFSEEELALLEAIAAREERTRSDALRRAVRFYARELGLDAPKPKRRTR